MRPAACVIASLLAVSPLARAQDADAQLQDEPPPPAPATTIASSRGSPPEHRIGFGFGLGGGYHAFGASGLGAGLGSVSLLDISLFIPVAPRLELQLWVPLAQVILSNLIVGPGFTIDVAPKWYPLGGGAGFFFAPGLEIAYASARGSSTSTVGLAVPVRIGYEFASDSRGFGFSLAAKPLAGVALVTATPSTVGVYGIDLELGFNFYGVK